MHSKWITKFSLLISNNVNIYRYNLYKQKLLVSTIRLGLSPRVSKTLPQRQGWLAQLVEHEILDLGVVSWAQSLLKTKDKKTLPQSIGQLCKSSTVTHNSINLINIHHKIKTKAMVPSLPVLSLRWLLIPFHICLCLDINKTQVSLFNLLQVLKAFNHNSVKYHTPNSQQPPTTVNSHIPTTQILLLTF